MATPGRGCENARAALNYVSRGQAPLGIVYRTDAADDGNVKIVSAFRPDTHPLMPSPPMGRIERCGWTATIHRSQAQQTT